MRLRSFVGIISLDLCVFSGAQLSLRQQLLQEAHQRVGEWHSDPQMLERPLVRNDIALTILKKDLKCGSSKVPVGFAEFDIYGARPVDVFNTVMNISSQPSWNPKCYSMKFVGDFIDEGAKSWDNVFNLIWNKKTEFLLWQVAEANFTSEEFWMVTSSQQNERLRAMSPKHPNWIESENCLGAYHITKTPTGSHVVITQHVHAEIGIWFPFHMILEVFPPAWRGMIDFITRLGDQSRKQAQLGLPPNYTFAPEWMLTDRSQRTAGNSSKMQLSFARISAKEVAENEAEEKRILFAALAAIIVGCFVCGGGIMCLSKTPKLRGYSTDDEDAVSLASYGSEDVICGRYPKTSDLFYQDPGSETEGF